MPIRFECNACKGTYDTVQDDGAAYFHVCPGEIWILALLDNGQQVERPLESFHGITLVPDQAAKDALVAAGENPHKIAIEISRSARQRPDHRDETTLTRTGPNGSERVIKSEGAGRAPKPDKPKPLSGAPRAL